jgi:hypothetical protein
MLKPEIVDVPAAAALPKPAPVAALGDGARFADHPSRLFRARAGDDGVLLICRRNDSYVRTFSRTIELSGANDAAIAINWYRAAWPDRPPDEVRKAAAKALKGAAR